MNLRKFIAIAILGIMTAIDGCSISTPSLPSGLIIERWPTKTPSPVPINDTEAIRQIIQAEGKALGKGDVDRLEGIWAKNGNVTDFERGEKWEGWKAIRDRYINIVFPSNPGFVEHPNIRIMINASMAVAVSDTKIGTTNRKDNDRWTLEKIEGRWQITSLTFGLPPEK